MSVTTEIKITNFEDNKKTTQVSYEETERSIYGIRCEVCAKLVEDWSLNRERCNQHLQ